MKKMTTLFKKNPNDLGMVINELNLDNEWVLTEGTPTRKFDGTSCAIINGELYKRYDAKLKKGKYKKPIPFGAIPCQEADLKSGHHPHWVKCDINDKSNKYHFEAFNKLVSVDMNDDGTYELIGEKINGNPENIIGHELFRHGVIKLDLEDFSFESIRVFLEKNDIEGIVFHNKYDDRMCKIRKSDFGIKR